MFGLHRLWLLVCVFVMGGLWMLNFLDWELLRGLIALICSKSFFPGLWYLDSGHGRYLELSVYLQERVFVPEEQFETFCAAHFDELTCLAEYGQNEDWRKERSRSWDMGNQHSLQPAAVQANKEQTDSMIDHFGWIHCWVSVHGDYSIVLCTIKTVNAFSVCSECCILHYSISALLAKCQLPFAAELKLYNPGSTFHRPRPPSRVASQQLLQPPFHNPSTATDYYKLQSPFSQLFYNTIPYRPNKQLFYTLFMLTF